MHKLRVNGIVEESIVDGPGLRYVVFTQGCPHTCKGCHNPETHCRDGGEDRIVEDLFRQFLENPLLAGITFSGGEPFLQPEPLVALGKKVKATGKSVLIYTGFTLEKLVRLAAHDEGIDQLLSLADMLVDGPYIESQRNLELLYRGSENQRLLLRRTMLQHRSSPCRAALPLSQPIPQFFCIEENAH